jgi:hypothetical protein
MRHRPIPSFLAVFLTAVAIASPSLAGGPPSFAFEAPSGPEGSSGPLLMVHAFSCHQPTDAAVRASAEGIVNGKRTTIPLRLKSTGATGVYSVTRQWPAQGSWVLVFNIDRGGQTTALVKLDAQGKPHFTSGKAGRELAAASLRTVSGSARERDIETVLVAKMGT